MKNHFQKRENDYLRRMLSGPQLESHLMKNGYLFEQWVFPPLIKTKTKLSGTGDCRTRRPIKYFAPKSNLKWREFCLIHPNNFQYACESLSRGNLIQNSLQALCSGTSIFSYSLPLGYKSVQRRGACQIKQWNDLQKDIALFASEYPYILIADISSCYHSIYTHAFEWVYDSLGMDKRIGGCLDESIRRGYDNKTHGLPVGPRITDYYAEVVLCNIDREIERNSIDIKYVAGRYRDNYFILCLTEYDAQKLVKKISLSLRQYYLSLNDEKTEILRTNEYLGNSWRIDHNIIKSTFDIDEESLSKVEGSVTIRMAKLETYIESILRLSNKYKHQKGIYEKGLAILEKLRPDNKNDYIYYYGLISRMYRDRIPALPKVLSLLSTLADEDKNCMMEFKYFITHRFEIAIEENDEFETLWLIYFMCQKKLRIKKVINILKRKSEPLYVLAKAYIEKMNLKSGKSIDICELLWGASNPNNSKIVLLFDKPKSSDEIRRFLNVKFRY